jgi:hypothetical protein
MILLLLIFWVLIYHGFVLWLALRFKSKPWRWYWFSTVLVVGLGIAWIDQLYIRFVVIDGYCEADKKRLGFREYAPAVVKASQVTWLGGEEKSGTNEMPRISQGIQKQGFEQDDYTAKKSNILECKKIDSKSAPCLIQGHMFVEKYKFFTFMGWHFATRNDRQLVREDRVLKESLNYAWSGSTFFRKSTGLEIPVLYSELQCGGDWNDVGGIGAAKNWIVTVEE